MLAWVFFKEVVEAGLHSANSLGKIKVEHKGKKMHNSQ